MLTNLRLFCFFWDSKSSDTTVCFKIPATTPTICLGSLAAQHKLHFYVACYFNGLKANLVGGLLNPLSYLSKGLFGFFFVWKVISKQLLCLLDTKTQLACKNKLNMREGKQYQRRHIEKRNFHFRESWTVDIHKNKAFSSQNHYIYHAFFSFTSWTFLWLFTLIILLAKCSVYGITF